MTSLVRVKDIALFAGLGMVSVGFILWLMEQVEAPAEFALTVEATTGGTTDPSPATYTYDVETYVTVTAIPSAGYEFKGWYLNGEFQTSELTFTVTVIGQELLIASFQEIGGPVLIPAYIRPIQNDRAEDWWHSWIEKSGVILENKYIRLGHDFYNDGFIKFKIADAAGNGVADQQIAIYTDPQPDPTDFGYVLLNGAIHEVTNPLILTSDSAGVVSVKVTYKWDEPDSDYRSTIGTGGLAHWTCPLSWGDTYPIYDGAWQGYLCYWSSFTRKRHPIYRNLNAIHAYWVDNPSLPVWGDCVADCMVKIEGDKKY